MRISCLSVSDQLGGSEVALAGMIATVRRARPDWQFQAVLPGNGPLRARLVAVGATCAVVSMPASLARIGEWAAVQEGWSTGARVALGLRLCAAAAALPRYEADLRRAIAEFQPDIIHSNGLKAHVFGARVKSPGESLVWHLHEYVSPRRLTRWLLRRYAARPSAIVAISTSIASDVAASLRATAPIHVVPNSVDLNVFSPVGPRLDLDRLAGLAPAAADVTRVGLIATYGRWKGHDVFLDAIERASLPGLRGYIIGGPLYDTSNSQYTRGELQAMIAARRLDDRVGLTGFVEPASAMRALDVIVHASTAPEPFGLAIAEGMACGCAVITTGQGGAAELIDAGQDALVAPAGNAGALADAMVRLGTDPLLRRTIGERARRAALVRFNPERMASQLAQVFETSGRQLPVAQTA